MNKLKRLAALALSLAMVFTMGMGVAADENDVAEFEDKGYPTLEAAVTAANDSADGGTITLLKDVTCGKMLQISKANVTIDGDNHTLTSSGYKAIEFLNTANGGEVTNLNIVANGHYGIHFYCCTGSMSNVHITGGDWYAVQVNGANVSINNCTLNPVGKAYGGIDFAMGSGVTTIPTITGLSNTTSSSALVVIDDETIVRMGAALSIPDFGGMDNVAKANAVLEALKTASETYLPGSVLKSMTVNEDGEIGAPANGSSSNNTYTPSKKRYTELPRNWWPEIEKIQKAEAGETVEIELRGDKVSAQVIDEAAGKDVNLAVNHLWNIYTVNGKDLKSDPARVYYTAADFIKEITAVEHTVTPVEE